MGRMTTDLVRVLRALPFWRPVLRIALLVAVTLAVLVAVFTAFFVLLPLAVIGGIALHFYLKRRFRRPAPPDGVIDAEYTVIDR